MPDYGIPLDERYRIALFAETGDVSEQAVIDLWTREHAVPAAEAQGRVHEVLCVGLERDEGVVGVSTAYLQRNRQLGMDLWHFRLFVASAHRMSKLAVLLALTSRDHLQDGFVTGRDTRGSGVLYEVENEGLKRYRNQALMLPVEFTFIGQNPRGDHVYVRYFPGAEAPRPPR